METAARKEQIDRVLFQEDIIAKIRKKIKESDSAYLYHQSSEWILAYELVKCAGGIKPKENWRKPYTRVNFTKFSSDGIDFDSVAWENKLKKSIARSSDHSFLNSAEQAWQTKQDKEALKKYSLPGHVYPMGNLYTVEAHDLFLKEKKKILQIFCQEMKELVKKTANQLDTPFLRISDCSQAVTEEAQAEKKHLEIQLEIEIEKLKKSRRELLAFDVNDICDSEHLPPAPGVYLAISKKTGEIEYVGQSKHIRTRISGHKHICKKENYFFGIISVENEKDRLEIERNLIEQLKPINNTRYL